MPAKKPVKKPAKKTASKFTADERAAMRDRAREAKGTGEADVLAKIKSLQPADRALAEKLHTLIRSTAPELEPKTWYGFPAYAKNGDVVVFFQYASRFKSRYATLGFSDKAKLDEGDMWPVTYALKSIDDAKIVALVKKALG